jgi:tetratricopeptide (TPR) repeat protein
MISRTLTIRGTLLAVFAFCSVANAQQEADTPSDTVRALLAQANDLVTVQFDNEAGLKLYQEVEELDPENYEALWGISRCYIDIGEHLPAKTDEEQTVQLGMYEKALAYANRAIDVKPTGSQGFLRRAIANGRIALFKGVWESLDLVKAVKEDAEKAITLDPGDATAYYIMGRTHAKVSEKPGIIRWPLGLGWASYEEAVEYYEKALELRPDFIMYRLDAARAYIELDEYETARKHLRAVVDIADQDEDDGTYRQEAMDLAEQIMDEE